MAFFANKWCYDDYSWLPDVVICEYQVTSPLYADANEWLIFPDKVLSTH